MIRFHVIALALALGLALAVGGAAQESPQPETPAATGQEPKPPSIELRAAEIPGVSVHFLTVPWGPQTFAQMQAAGDGFYNERTWPFARLETSVAVRLGGHAVLPGNYALVFHPNNARDEGMALEVVRIGAGEFLKPGSAFTPTPHGERLFKEPVRFDTADGIAPTLEIKLGTGSKGTELIVSYGNQRLRRDIEPSP